MGKSENLTARYFLTSRVAKKYLLREDMLGNFDDKDYNGAKFCSNIETEVLGKRARGGSDPKTLPPFLLCHRTKMCLKSSQNMVNVHVYGTSCGYRVKHQHIIAINILLYVGLYICFQQ